MNKTKMTMILFITAIVCSFALLPLAVPDEAFEYVEITVLPGDTVWSISNGFAVAGEDIRAVVERVYKENRLDAGNVIRPGQKIIVPVPKGPAGEKIAFAGRGAVAP
ncbi:MAG: LysM peptidoglycan-binding domain-containing protein [Acidaminococcales bacterium]|jgi:LysM repeat protein|nr:LysM peptidoglycan-binding domain-containing protein [Acidaminococcales bacterium]